ncbi:MAG: ATP-binding protein, partial [Patescibacteria group bacterium]
MDTDKSFLFLMLGFPGSGKSYVSGWLAPHMSAVHLRADDMRVRMFGEERLEYHTNWKYQKQVHGAMQYAAAQVLSAEHSVIYDSNHNSVKSRRPMQSIAKEAGAIPILIWVKAPLGLAKQRVLDREAAAGPNMFELDFVDRMASNLQQPGPNELAIELDCTQTAEDQR